MTRLAAHRTYIEDEGWMLDPDALAAKLIERGVGTSDLPGLLALAAAARAEEADPGQSLADRARAIAADLVALAEDLERTRWP